MMSKLFAMNFETLKLDLAAKNLPSLRSLLMNLKSNECIVQNLFVSVDTDFKNTNQVNFSFIPSLQHEARHFISNMVPIFLNTYAGQNIASYFQEDAVLRGTSCVWDIATQSVINSDEAYLQTFNDSDMDSYDISRLNTISAILPHDYTKVQNNLIGTELDSVGIIKTSKTYSYTSGCVVDNSTRSIYTENTTLTRLHVVEEAISKVQSKLSSFDTKLDAMFKVLLEAKSEMTSPNMVQNKNCTPQSLVIDPPLHTNTTKTLPTLLPESLVQLENENLHPLNKLKDAPVLLSPLSLYTMQTTNIELVPTASEGRDHQSSLTGAGPLSRDRL